MTHKKKKILIADDDPGILEVMQLMLEDEGYEVITTVNGRTVEAIKEHLPDLILLDIWMSGQDGRNICRGLKSKETTKHIPVIMVSANKDTEDIAKQAGADDFLSKPFDIENLLGKVKRYLS
jgi:CheY-like chemotaxis protein